MVRAQRLLMASASPRGRMQMSMLQWCTPKRHPQRPSAHRYRYQRANRWLSASWSAGFSPLHGPDWSSRRVRPPAGKSKQWSGL